MKSLTCSQCGIAFARTGRSQKFCGVKCQAQDGNARRKAKRKALADLNCPTCGNAFKPRSRRQTFCSQACWTKAYLAKPKTKNATTPRPISDDMVARILSDSLFSGAIADELDALRASKSQAIAALQSVLTAELPAPTWPTGRLARAALALILLRDNPAHGRFRHPHEKRALRYRPSGVIVGRGGSRVR